MKNKKINRNERCMLKGKFKKNGFDRWRLVTNAVSPTGQEKTFFFEFYLLNPAVSPKEAVLGFKSRFGKSAADLQYALAGTDSAKTASVENAVIPSFFMVRAGLLSAGGKQMSCYYANDQVEYGKSDYIICVGKHTEKECILGTDFTLGSVCVDSQDLTLQPELLCSEGSIIWNIHFERSIISHSQYNSRVTNWTIPGVKLTCSGTVVFDGEEYNIIPEKSNGYYDKNWGQDFSSPFFHLNSSTGSSLITGKTLKDTAFCVQGEFQKSLSVLAYIEGQKYEFPAQKSKDFDLVFDCSEIEDSEKENKLHWSVSVHNGKTVLDIDIFCDAFSMYLRDYESPCGDRKVMKVLGGANGTGELRLYRRVKKNLELLEHVQVLSCVCEYGNMELPEK